MSVNQRKIDYMMRHFPILCAALITIAGCGQVVQDNPDGSVLPVCGNGIVEADEVCDDGNDVADDSCDPACSAATCLVPTTHPTVEQGLDDDTCATLWIYSGTYTENVSITRDMTIEAVGAAEVVIDGGGNGSTIAVAVDTTVTLRGFKVSGGSASSGGGIYNEAALTLEQMIIEGNTATGESSSGGGIYTSESALVLDGTLVTGNVATSTGLPDGSPFAHGGGIYAEGGSITLRNGSAVAASSATISGHPNARGSGGGIYASGAVVVLDAGTAVRDNRAEIDGGDAFARGGGIYTTGGGSIALVEDAAIENNLARATGPGIVLAYGGGVYADRDPLTVNLSSRLDGNTAHAEGPDGGVALAGAAYLREANMVLSTSQAIGNTAKAISDGTGANPSVRVEGGAFWADSGFGQYTLAITDSTIANNLAEASTTLPTSSGSARGGAAYISSPTGSNPPIQSIDLRRSTVSGNRAVADGNAFGGAFYARSSTGSATVVIEATNATISGNAAESAESTGRGGAIYAETSTGSARAEVYFSNATVTGNAAVGVTSEGGALYLRNGISSSVTAAFWKSSIVWGNSATTSPECLTSGMSVTSSDFNLIGTATGCTLAGLLDNHVSGDPLMGTLGDNAGATQTHPLSDGSPAVNAGNPAGCTDRDGNPLITDQRGQPRAALGRCDIGAFEYVP